MGVQWGLETLDEAVDECQSECSHSVRVGAQNASDLYEIHSTAGCTNCTDTYSGCTDPQMLV